MNDPWEWSKKFQDLLTANPINTIGKTRYSSGIAGATSRNISKSGGSWFSKTNAPKTASIANAISIGLGALAKLTDKSKKGQPGPTTGNLNLMANSNDWTQFFM